MSATLSAPQYPSNLPLANITSVIDALRGGISANKAQLGYDIWVVQGFGQKVLLGDPTAADAPEITPSVPPADGSPFTLMSAPASTDDVQITIQALEKVTSGEPTTQAGVPWEIVIPVLLKLLEGWLARRKQG